jgi:hypothetical protein
MPVAAILPALIAAGGSIAGGLLNNKPKTQTGTSNTTATYTPEQQAIMEHLRRILAHRLRKGPEVLQSDRNAGRTSINNTYNAVQPNVESQLTARGFGDSGKLGSAILGLNVQRANQFQGLESTLTDQAQNRYEQAIQDSLAFSRPTGSSTTSTQTLPGPGLGGTVAGIGGDLATLLFLSKFLKGGGGGPTLDAGDSAGGGGY